MRLRRLTLENTKLLRDFRWPGKHGDSMGDFTVFVAENGLCKTTLLQVIALAAAGPTGANKLTPDVTVFRDRRIDDAKAESLISAHFEVSQRYHRQRSYPGFRDRPDVIPALYSRIWLGHQWSFLDGDSEFDPAPSPPEDEDERRRRKDPVEAIRREDLPHWFVAGYGTSRVLPPVREIENPSNRAIGRMASLFRAEPLIATGFADLLSNLYSDDLARAFASTLRNVLVGNPKESLPGLVPHDSDQPKVCDIELRGQGGVRSTADLIDSERFVLEFGGVEVKIPATWLSQGYQGTIAWVADLIGQIFWEAGEAVPPREMEGLVLIDEIDLHLHPRWQAMLVPALKRTFPRIQFIATTHSPMILPGLKQEEVVVLRLGEDGHVHAHPAPFSPALKTGSEIYDGFFGIHELFPTELGRILRDWSWLANDPERSEEDERRMRALGAKLDAAGVEKGFDPVARRAPGGDP